MRIEMPQGHNNVVARFPRTHTDGKYPFAIYKPIKRSKLPALLAFVGFAIVLLIAVSAKAEPVTHQSPIMMPTCKPPPKHKWQRKPHVHYCESRSHANPLPRPNKVANEHIATFYL